MAKLLLTPEAQSKVDALLAAEPAPVLPPAQVTRLVDEYQARANGIAARAEAIIERFTTAIELRQAVAKRYGLLGAIVKVLYWKVSWHDLAYRTKRKFYLERPACWEEVS